jgi:glucokinase
MTMPHDTTVNAVTDACAPDIQSLVRNTLLPLNPGSPALAHTDGRIPADAGGLAHGRETRTSPAPRTTRVIAALDIGGTKIAGALVDDTGQVLARAIRPTPNAEHAVTVVAAVNEVLDELSTAPAWSAAGAVAVGSAGPIDTARGTVSPVNIPAWRDFPLLEHIRRHHAAAALPALLCGDAIALAAAEYWLGAAQGHRNALCMVVSTGVGGGLILNGAVYPGPTGNAGHIGHISVQLDGEPCPCGSRGCLERLASGPAIVRSALSAGWKPTGPDHSAAAVARDARTGEHAAVAAFARAGQALAAAIAATAALVEIEIVVIGGGVAQAHDVLFPPLRAALARYAALPFTRDIPVSAADLSADAGLIGAAALGFHELMKTDLNA